MGSKPFGSSHLGSSHFGSSHLGSKEVFVSSSFASLLSTKHHGLVPTSVVGSLVRLTAVIASVATAGVVFWILHSDVGGMPGRRSYHAVVGPLTVQQLRRQQRDIQYRAYPGQGFSYLRVASEHEEDIRSMAEAKSIKHDREAACQSPANDGWRASLRAKAMGVISSGVCATDMQSFKKRARAWHGPRVAPAPPPTQSFGVTGLVDSWEQLDDSFAVGPALPPTQSAGVTGLVERRKLVDDSLSQILLHSSHVAIFGPAPQTFPMDCTPGVVLPPVTGCDHDITITCTPGVVLPPVSSHVAHQQVAHVGVQTNLGHEVYTQATAGCDVGIQSGSEAGNVAPVTICLDTALFPDVPPGSASSLVSRIQCEQVLAYLPEKDNVAVAPCNVSEVGPQYIGIGDELHEGFCMRVDAVEDVCTHNILHEEFCTQVGIHVPAPCQSLFGAEEVDIAPCAPSHQGRVRLKVLVDFLFGCLAWTSCGAALATVVACGCLDDSVTQQAVHSLLEYDAVPEAAIAAASSHKPFVAIACIVILAFTLSDELLACGQWIASSCTGGFSLFCIALIGVASFFKSSYGMYDSWKEHAAVAPCKPSDCRQENDSVVCVQANENMHVENQEFAASGGLSTMNMSYNGLEGSSVPAAIGPTDQPSAGRSASPKRKQKKRPKKFEPQVKTLALQARELGLQGASHAVVHSMLDGTFGDPCADSDPADDFTRFVINGVSHTRKELEALMESEVVEGPVHSIVEHACSSLEEQLVRCSCFVDEYIEFCTQAFDEACIAGQVTLVSAAVLAVGGVETVSSHWNLCAAEIEQGMQDDDDPIVVLPDDYIAASQVLAQYFEWLIEQMGKESPLNDCVFVLQNVGYLPAREQCACASTAIEMYSSMNAQIPNPFVQGDQRLDRANLVNRTLEPLVAACSGMQACHGMPGLGAVNRTGVDVWSDESLINDGKTRKR